MLDRIRDWLLGYPGWEPGVTVFMDTLDSVPGCGGLYPQGTEEVARRTDVLGNVRIRCRLRCMVYRVVSQGEDFAPAARWMADFSQWVRQQAGAGLAPRLGSGEEEWIQARNGRLVRRPQAGTGIYGVEIVAEYWDRGMDNCGVARGED